MLRGNKKLRERKITSNKIVIKEFSSNNQPRIGRKNSQMKGATVFLGHPVYAQVPDGSERIYMRMCCVVGIR